PVLDLRQERLGAGRYAHASAPGPKVLLAVSADGDGLAALGELRVAGLVLPRPRARAGDLVEVGAVGVALGDLRDLDEQALLQRRGLEAQVEEGVVASVEVVLGVLLARVRHVGDLDAGRSEERRVGKEGS